MKLIKLPPERTPEIWEYLELNLPDKLESIRFGYNGITIVKDSIFSFTEDNVIARAYNDNIEIYDSNYLSKFVELIEKYEKDNKKVVTVRYWE